MKMSAKFLKRVLTLYEVPFTTTDGVRRLRRCLKSYVSVLRRGKQADNLRIGRQQERDKDEAERLRQRERIRQHWPQLVSSELKQKILNMFCEETSSAGLASFTCATCAGEYPKNQRHMLPFEKINPTLLSAQADIPANVPLPSHSLLGKDDGLLFHPAGIEEDCTGRPIFQLCKGCCRALKADKVPPLALANLTYLGPIPSELQNLTVIEEAIIAQSCAKCWIVQLTEDSRDITLPSTQRALKGHVIVYPQRPSEIARILPPSVDEIITPVCVLFVGSSPPSADWL